jgi:hypothetical protein
MPQLDGSLLKLRQVNIKFSEETVYSLTAVTLIGVLALALCTRSAMAEGSVSD